MELKNYIKIFDNAIDPEKIGSLIKYLNKVKFKETAVIDSKKGNVVNKKIRNTDSWVFDDSSYSNVHWKNFLNHTLENVYYEYGKNLNLKSEVNCTEITSIEALKYEEGGFYTIHYDHHSAAPRTLSMILFLNNDYEGGELIFDGPKRGTEKIETVLPTPGRVIVWPSNFLYPHSVEKVTKGTRYTVVSWLA